VPGTDLAGQITWLEELNSGRGFGVNFPVFGQEGDARFDCGLQHDGIPAFQARFDSQLASSDGSLQREGHPGDRGQPEKILVGFPGELGILGSSAEHTGRFNQNEGGAQGSNLLL